MTDQTTPEHSITDAQTISNDAVSIEAATRVRNTLYNRLTSVSNITVVTPDRDDLNQDATHTGFSVVIQIAVTRSNGLLHQPGTLVDEILNQTFLYAGTEYTLESPELQHSSEQKPDAELRGEIQVIPA